MKRIKNPNPQKFEKDRSVSSSWEKIPIIYTGLIKPDNKGKELVIVQFFGDYASACWRNNELCKMGITFLVKLIKGGFILKGRKYYFKKMNRVW